MNKILRNATLAAAVAASLSVGTPADAAPIGGAFVGEASINCFGCGSSTGTAELCAEGYVHPTAVVTACVDPNKVAGWATSGHVNPLPINPNLFASYTVAEPAGATCVVTGTASGTTTGVVNVTFNWTRLGAVAVISTSGDVNGSGLGVFVVTEPQGIPCGGPVTAVVAGVLLGV